MPDARFHLIGHLQSNKAKSAAELFHVIQTVDTPKLARRLDAIGKRLDVMIEVKLSHEQAKAGADPCSPSWTDRCDPRLPESAACRTDDHASLVRRSGSCRGLISGGCASLAKLSCVSGLSMGMSHDFEAAIEEGATHIRVGTALFGKRRKAVTLGFYSPSAARSYRRRGLQRGVACGSATARRSKGECGDGDVQLYHVGNNQLHRCHLHARARASGRDRPARCGAATLLRSAILTRRVHRRVRL